MHCTELHVKMSLFYWMFVSVYISVVMRHDPVQWLSSMTGTWRDSAGAGEPRTRGCAVPAVPVPATRSTRCRPPHQAARQGGWLEISVWGGKSNTCYMKPLVCGSKKYSSIQWLKIIYKFT